MEKEYDQNVSPERVDELEHFQFISFNELNSDLAIKMR